jgi:putative endonuclease
MLHCSTIDSVAEKDERGRAGERRAAEHLRGQGYEILARNWRCPLGELDIVAASDRHLVVVEVKTRRSDRFGHPFEAVDARKRTRLWQLARAWRREHPEHAHGRDLRLDAIGVLGDDPATGSVEHLEDLR